MPSTTNLYAPYGLPHIPITNNWLANILTAALFTTLGTTVLALRLLNTFLRGRPLDKDDYAMYAAYLASIGYTISSVIALRWGVGLHKEDVPSEWVIEAMKATYAVEIFYYLAIFLVKMSILCMYLRLSVGLGRQHKFYKATVWTMMLLVAHFITTMIVAGLQCIPMAKYWNPLAHIGKGHCINITAFFYSTNAFTILTDLIILILPVPTFWKLQMGNKRKAAVIGIFAVGGVSTVASCVRLYSIKRFGDEAKGLENAAPINTWSFVEIYLGIFCASVPAIKTLFIRTPSARNNAQNTPKRSTTGTGGGAGTRHSAGAQPDDLRTNISTSHTGNFAFSGRTDRDTHHNHHEEDLELGNLARAGFSDAQLGLQSAVMTSSRGKLERYKVQSQPQLEPGSHGTTGSSVLSAAPGSRGEEVREVV